jgi:hypothetical protein
MVIGGLIQMLTVLPATALLVAFPAIVAWRRRAQSRDDSEVALALQSFALALRRGAVAGKSDPELVARVAELAERVPESRAFLFALDLARLDPAMLADAAQRLGLRLRRRVAFERKMLARTRSGLRRAAVAAALPALLWAGLLALGLRVPDATLLFVLLVESVGCYLLWRITRAAV